MKYTISRLDFIKDKTTLSSMVKQRSDYHSDSRSSFSKENESKVDIK